MNDLDIQSLSRLRWACRRGMLELDVLLSNFLNERFESLSIEQKHEFARLLTFQDPDLFAWLMGKKRPDDENLAFLVDEIRSHAQSRF